MGARDRQPEGLIKRWRGRGDTTEAVETAATTSPPEPPLRPVASAKERLAVARRQQRQAASDAQDVPPAADPVLLAKLAALEAAATKPARTEPAPGSMKERLAARRAALGEVRRDASAAVLGALDVTGPANDPTVSPTAEEAATTTVPPSAAVAPEGSAATSDDDIIAALRDLPAHSAAASAAQAPDHGRHRGTSATSPDLPATDDLSAGAADPALQATLRAIEAAEATQQEQPRRRLLRRRGDADTPQPSAPAEAPAASTPAPVAPAESGPMLDPVVARAMRAGMDADEKSAAARSTSSASTGPTPTRSPRTSQPAAPTPPDDVPERPREVAARRTPPTRPAPEPGRRDREPRLSVRDLSNAPTSPKAPPGVVQFSPRRSTRQLLGMLALLSLLGAIGTGFLAWEARGTTEIAVACTLGVLTLILWSAFSTAAPAKLTIDRGVLDILSKESRHRFDLASPYLEITVKGRPGKRNWQVQIHRRGMKPYVIDSSMVDPEEFQPVLEHYREVAAETAAENERRRERR